MQPGTGKMFVMKDARVFYFCSTKCEKNMMRMNRKPRETRWTAEFAHVKKKDTKK
jgi:large subunit ribosomal protein L24e